MRDRHARVLGAFLILGLASSLLLACGISYGEDETGTELFKELSIEGELRPFTNLTMVLDYEQPYPANIDVECDLLELDSEATPRPTTTATPTLEPDVTPTPPPIPKPRPTPAGKISVVFAGAIPENPDGGPVDEATPEPGTIQQMFRAPEFAGKYAVWCFTPADENNAILEEFTIRS